MRVLFLMLFNMVIFFYYHILFSQYTLDFLMNDIEYLNATYIYIYI